MAAMAAQQTRQEQLLAVAAEMEPVVQVPAENVAFS